jgi:NAD(P)-dependent dehydrogenase (short-subunit alcohol dehydrogenase family)
MPFQPHVAGAPDPALATLLTAAPYRLRLLVNADPVPDDATIIARCEAFAAEQTETGPEALIITLLPTPSPGLAQFRLHKSVATLWAFTRQAALEWAPRRIRVNAIGLGATPFGPDEPDEQAGRTATPVLATRATQADIASTVHAIADFASMTGQIIRLGA